MADDTTIGYSIEIKGTDTAVGQMGDMKRELLDLTTKFNSLKDSTAGNVGAQKAAATQMAVLSTQIKALTSDINTQQQAIIKAANEQTAAVGSYNQLSLQLSDVTAQWKALSAEERDNTEAGQALTAQRLELNNQLKALDATVNVHTRNVGNYSGELIKNGRAVAGLAGLMDILGKVFGVDAESLSVLKETHSEMTMAMRDLTHITAEESEATEASTVVNEANIASTEEQTVVEKALLAVKELSAVAWAGIIFAVAAATAAIIGYIVGSKSQEEQEKKTQVAVDGTIIKNKELRDSYNAIVTELTEIDNAWKVHQGVITELDAAYSNLAAKNRVTMQDIKNDTQTKINEMTGLWEGLKSAMSQAFGGESLQDKIDAIRTEANNKEMLALVKEEADKKKLKEDLIAKNQEEEQANLDEWQRKQDEEAKTRASKIAEQIKANQAEILKLKSDLIKESFDLQKAGTEREFAQIEDKYDSEILLVKSKITEKLSSNKALADSEIALNKEANAQIVELEKLKEADIDKLGKAAEKSEIDNLIKQNDLKKQTVLQEIANDEQQAKDAVTRSTGTAKEKSEAMLAIDIDYSNRKLAVSKQIAIDDLLILKNSADAETEETKLKIAKLQAVIDQAARVPPDKTLMAQLFGTDSNNAKLIIDDALSLVKQASDAVFTAQQASNARALTAQLDHIDKQNTMAANGLQAQLSAGLITQTQYDLQTAAQADKVAKEQDDAKKAAFEKDKELKKKQIGVNLALEIVKIAVAYADIPYEGWAQAAIQAGEAAAAAAIQIEAIDNEQYSGGGVLKGASHEEGGIPFTVNGKSGFEAESDEILLAKGVYRNPYLRSMASQINVAGGGKHFALGGPVPTAMAASSSKQFVPDLSGFAQQIIQGINNKKVYQNVTEVTDKQNELQQLATDSSF